MCYLRWLTEIKDQTHIPDELRFRHFIYSPNQVPSRGSAPWEWYDVCVIERLLKREPLMPSFGFNGTQRVHRKAPVPLGYRQDGPGAGLFVLNTDAYLHIACG